MLLEIGDEEINKQDRHCTYNVTLRRSRVTIVAVEKQWILHILSVLSAVLVIQHAERVRRIILSSVAFLGLPHFSTLCHKLLDFR